MDEKLTLEREWAREIRRWQDGKISLIGRKSKVLRAIKSYKVSRSRIEYTVDEELTARWVGSSADIHVCFLTVVIVSQRLCEIDGYES